MLSQEVLSPPGCPTLSPFFGEGWDRVRLGTAPIRSRFRAVHWHSTSTLPSQPVAH